MNNKEEIIKLLNLHFNTYFDSTNIGNIRYEMSRYTPITNTNQYDELSITSFIIFYKIDKLVEHNIINNNIANALKELYLIRQKIIDEYMSILFKIESKNNNNKNFYLTLKDTLKNKINLIDNKLKQYHLYLYDFNKIFDISKTIDNNINLEDYDNLDDEISLNNFVKKIKKDY